MTVSCTIDGTILTLSLNSNKPLSLILMENLSNPTIKARCEGRQCGGCIVLMDGKAVPSCMVPAFEIRDKVITTFSSFKLTNECKDIEKAYSAIGYKPCENCYNSKTFVIESIISRYVKNDLVLNKMDILQEYNMIKCRCLDLNDFIRIVEEALTIRKRRLK